MSWDSIKQDIYSKWKTYWFATHPHDVAEYSWNYLFTGGKEIRAKLFCELWEYLSPDLNVSGELAFAIECIHVASIVLDDTPWMDNATKRRGKDTLHIVFSPKKAVLLASEVMDIARHIWKTNRPSHVSEQRWQQLLIQKLQMLATGQLYDLEKKGTLLELASLKTGVLFELVTETVALCTNLDTDFWCLWGRYLGILFQWMDDWQDRDEDLLQHNRNAFLESYDDTLHNYQVLWKKLETSIGSTWFSRPFGTFMMWYFTGCIPVKDIQPTPSSSLLEQLNIDYSNCIIPLPEQTKPLSSKHPISGIEIVQRILQHSHEFFTQHSLRTYLWDIDETEWEHTPDIQELLSRVPIHPSVLSN